MKITDTAEALAWQAYVTACQPMDTRRRPAVRAALEAAGPHLLADDSTSDGYHTVGELYQHRMLLTAALFTTWHYAGIGDVHKSARHSDGELCFGGGWFIVVAQLPTGQISYHYPEKDWALFDVPVREIPAEFDGHTADEALQRLERFLEGVRPVPKVKK